MVVSVQMSISQHMDSSTMLVELSDALPKQAFMQKYLD